MSRFVSCKPKNNYFYVTFQVSEKKTVEELFCEEFSVTDVEIDVVTKRQKLRIAINFWGEWTYIPQALDRSELLDDPRKVLSEFGLTVENEPVSNEYLCRIINDLECDAQIVYTHSSLGYAEIDGARIFLLHHPIGLFDNDPYASSTYVDSSATKSKGSLQGWTEGIFDYVIGNAPLELALAISASAPLVPLLQRKKRLDLLPMVALIGDSTTGKTTSLRLMASLWGNPNENGGVIGNLNCTQNAFYAALASKVGLPLLIDETSTKAGFDFDSLLYHLPTGTEKSRCNNDGTVKEAKKYSGTIVFTGETSMLRQTSGNDGLYARLLELTLTWTESADHAEGLVRAIKANYAQAATPLMMWILQNEQDIADAFDAELELGKLIYDEESLSSVEKRLLTQTAVFITAARVLRRGLFLPIDIEGIRSLLFDAVKKNTIARENDASPYDILCNMISTNQARFPNKYEFFGNQTYDPWGVELDDWYFVFVNKFNEMLGIKDIQTHNRVLNQLHKDGNIKRCGDRYVARVTGHGGVRVSGYYIKKSLKKVASSKNKDFLMGS